MKIAMTYDLRQDYLARGFSDEQSAEFDSPETIDGIERALVRLGYGVERVGSLPELVRRLALGARWDMVFNIAEGVAGPGRESQIPALLEGYDIPCTFSDSSLLALCLHKGMTKHVLAGLGLPSAPFAVCSRAAELKKVRVPGPWFVKPVAEGTSKGVSPTSLARTRAALVREGERLLVKFGQPVLVETFLPGREFTVGIVGTGSAARAVGCMEVLLTDKAQQEVYTYENKQEYEDRVSYRLVRDADAKGSVALALAAWRGLGCRDAGRVDVRLDASGAPNVIELNPLPGLNPEHSDLPIMARLAGWSYTRLIGTIMDAALARTGAANAAQGRA